MPLTALASPSPANGRSGSSRIDWDTRAKASGLHLLLSLGLACLAAFLVFGLWYPDAYQVMAGGRELFLLVSVVDVVIGPMLTFAVFDHAKGLRALRRDLVVIGTLQVSALVYGMHTVYIARPVGIVFEVDRFRLVTADAVLQSELPEAAEAFRKLPLTGPWLIGARRPEAGSERNDALFLGAAGIDVGQRPRFWQPYEASRSAAREKSRPLQELFDHAPDRASQLKAQVARFGVDPVTARFLPIMARGDWVAILDHDGNVLGHLNADGFF